MKFALFFGLCLAFAFVAHAFEEDEFLEDELEDIAKRHIYKGCNTDGDCDARECCYKNWFYHRCKAKKQEGEFCTPDSDCYFSCEDGLECRKTGNGFLSYHKCQQPEGSGNEYF